jgi:hypothetical protein
MGERQYLSGKIWIFRKYLCAYVGIVARKENSDVDMEELLSARVSIVLKVEVVSPEPP